MESETNTPQTVIIISEWYNALYIDGKLAEEGKPDYLNGETMIRLNPKAPVYQMDDQVYDQLLAGAGYPPHLTGLPLNRLQLLQKHC